MNSTAVVNSSTDAKAVMTAERLKEQQIVVLLTRLQAHYWRPDLPTALSREVMIDRVDDLREFDIAAIEAACNAWRRGAENKWFPKPGEMIALVHEEQQCIRERARFMALPLEDPHKKALAALVDLVNIQGQPVLDQFGWPSDVMAVPESVWRKEMEDRGIIAKDGPYAFGEFCDIRRYLALKGLTGWRHGMTGIREDMVWAIQIKV